MSMKSPIILGVVLLILLIGGGIAYALGIFSPAQPPGTCSPDSKICKDGAAVHRSGVDCEFEDCPEDISHECDADGRICPDGTIVGRTGAQCEFAQCPIDTPVRTVTIALNGVINVRGESIRPVEVVEDSRCPADAQCIWAGTVRVKLLITTQRGEIEQIVSLDNTVSSDTQTIKLTGVAPARNAGDSVDPKDYVFTFEVRRLE